MANAVVDTNRPFAAVASTFVGIQNRVDLLRLVGGGSHDAAVFELKLDVVKHRALVTRLGVELDFAVDAVANRRRENFAVRNVSIASTRDDRDALDRKLELG